jgi:hypothetical protein
MMVDAGIHYVFAIKPGTDPCQVTEQSQFYLVSGGVRHGPVTTVACQRSAVTASGVTLRCGGRDILIPSTVSGCNTRYPGMRCTGEATHAPGSGPRRA